MNENRTMNKAQKRSTSEWELCLRHRYKEPFLKKN
jgi:hypothetical protein